MVLQVMWLGKTHPLLLYLYDLVTLEGPKTVYGPVHNHEESLASNQGRLSPPDEQE